jgi:hypothetical protein
MPSKIASTVNIAVLRPRDIARHNCLSVAWSPCQLLRKTNPLSSDNLDRGLDARRAP